MRSQYNVHDEIIKEEIQIMNMRQSGERDSILCPTIKSTTKIERI